MLTFLTSLGSAATNLAQANEPFAASLAGSATDPDGRDVLEYRLVRGPAWLIVNSNGSVIGTPTRQHLGLNTFEIEVHDGQDAAAQAQLEIVVTDSSTHAAYDLRVESTHTLTSPDWVTVGAVDERGLVQTTVGTELLVGPEFQLYFIDVVNPANDRDVFYRVLIRNR